MRKTIPVSKAMKAKDAQIAKLKKQKEKEMKAGKLPDLLAFSFITYPKGKAETDENKICHIFTKFIADFQKSFYYEPFLASIERKREGKETCIPTDMYVKEYIEVFLYQELPTSRYGKFITDFNIHLLEIEL